MDSHMVVFPKDFRLFSPSGIAFAVGLFFILVSCYRKHPENPSTLLLEHLDRLSQQHNFRLLKGARSSYPQPILLYTTCISIL